MSFENWNGFLQETLSRLNRERTERKSSECSGTKKAARHGKYQSDLQKECNTHSTYHCISDKGVSQAVRMETLAARKRRE